MFGKRNKADQAKQKRVRLHEATHENDIRFRGPLTTQHFKILGWICIVIAQVVVLLTLGARMNDGLAERTSGWQDVLTNIANLSLPFLLIASFAQMLNTEEGYRRQLLLNGAAMVGVCAAYYLVFYRYIVGGVAAFLAEPSDALPSVNAVLGIVMPYGFFAFNIFVDLFLCTLCMLFLNYRPRRFFKGKSCFIFRLFALLPIAYEAGCMVLKVRAAKGLIAIPTWAYPLLTVKPPMTFVLFLALAMFVKTRELRFRRHGKTHEEYREFLKTRRNAWNFSVFLAIMLVLVSIADTALIFGFSLSETMQFVATNMETSLSEAGADLKGASDEEIEAALNSLQGKTEGEEALPKGTEPPAKAQADGGIPEAAPPSPGEEEAAHALPSPGEEEAAHAPTTPGGREAAIREALSAAMDEESIAVSLDWNLRLAGAVGFGGSVYLIYLAPLVLLFSYTRKPKYRLVDMLIPVAGIALILIVYIEGIHQLLGYLPVGKINLEELKDMVTNYVEMLM